MTKIRLLRRLMLLIGAVALLGVSWIGCQLNRRPSLEPYAKLWLAPADVEAADLTVTFLGVSTLLFDDGQTAILTDGFFSRPAKSALLGKIAPDRKAVVQSLKRAGIERLAALIVLHSHYDHALDSAEVALSTGALLAGSESAAQIARGGGLPEERIRAVRDGEALKFGRFEVTFIRSDHGSPTFAEGEIGAPLEPPAWILQYREGGSYSVLIRHDNKSMLVQASSGFVEGALQAREAEVVFLGVGTLGKQDEEDQQAYWREVPQAVGARRVILIHWDDFTLPLEEPFAPLPYLLDDFDKTMSFARRQAGIEVKLPTPWVRFDPFAGL